MPGTSVRYEGIFLGEGDDEDTYNQLPQLQGNLNLEVIKSSNKNIKNYTDSDTGIDPSRTTVSGVRHYLDAFFSYLLDWKY